MKSTVLLFLVLTALSLTAQQELQIPPESRDPVQKLIQTYCGEKPIPMSFLVQFADGSQLVVSRKELNEYKKVDPKLVVLGEGESGGQFATCKNMVLQKAVDADFSSLIEENKKLRSALHSLCALPDIGRTAKDSCSAFWRDLDEKKK
jgi:hypothetical protein